MPMTKDEFKRAEDLKSAIDANRRRVDALQAVEAKVVSGEQGDKLPPELFELIRPQIGDLVKKSITQEKNDLQSNLAELKTLIPDW